MKAGREISSINLVGPSSRQPTSPSFKRFWVIQTGSSVGIDSGAVDWGEGKIDDKGTRGNFGGCCVCSLS